MKCLIVTMDIFITGCADGKENACTKVLYTLDHWSGQIDKALYKDIAKNLQLEFVPEKTTSMCQPLDVYFNRQLKYVVRKIYNYAMVHGNHLGQSVELLDRNSIIKIQSIAHFILSAPIFTKMIKHSFFQAGFTKEKINCDNAFTTCFKLSEVSCSFDQCCTIPFIKCSWCSEELCFDHFVTEYHVVLCPKGPYF